MQKGLSSLILRISLFGAMLIGLPSELFSQCAQLGSQQRSCLERAPDGTLTCIGEVSVTYCQWGYTHGMYCKTSFVTSTCCSSHFGNQEQDGFCGSGGGGDQPMFLVQEHRFQQLAHRIYVRDCSGNVERLDAASLKIGTRR
jgi:hypothetical protein